MCSITVTCLASDPRADRQAPPLRRTRPQRDLLDSPLARFLVASCPPSVAGPWHSGQREMEVTCRVPWLFYGVLANEADTALPAPRIADWRFDPIAPDQSDEGYWNAQAEKMLAAGVTRVEIGPAVFTVEPRFPLESPANAAPVPRAAHL